MMYNKASARQLFQKLLFYIMLLIFTLVTILPFLWMISSSFKGQEAIRTIPIRWIPEHPTLEGYERVFNMQGFSFIRSSLNSLVLAIACTFVAVTSATMAAFVFAKLPFKGSGKLFGIYLATMMIPGTVTMVPNYIILRVLGLLDTYTGLILPSLANAFGVFLMRQSMMSVNNAYMESAYIDGASLYQIFFRIMLPMVTVPGIIIVARYMPKSFPLPLKGNLANTNAAIVAEVTATKVQAIASTRLFKLDLIKEKPCILKTRS
jgi:multiple sugar transport system permease protein